MPDDLLDYVARSPTPYHAVRETVRRLESAGFSPLDEAERWELGGGDRRYVVRGDGTIVAFVAGSEPPADAGFRLIGAHTDSPGFRIRPLPDRHAEGYRQLGVEPYGGVLFHTWLDRDLSIAGRVAIGGASLATTVLLDFRQPIARIPSLAIHLHREIREDGLRLNAQRHLMPLVGMGDGAPLRNLVAGELRSQGIEGSEILGFDLLLYDVQPPARGGIDGELLCSARLDNLASCHAALRALLENLDEDTAATRVIVLYDHEEVGSRSAEGAGGSVLLDVLGRVATARSPDDREATERANARSILVSTDMAHAVHPNYPDKHDADHRPRLGGGPVLKVNANLAYASDAASAAVFRTACRTAGIEPQVFVSRSDIACGSTIGPISAARLGIRTVDVGNPLLGMHSVRETAAARDVEPMIRALSAFFLAS